MGLWGRGANIGGGGSKMLLIFADTPTLHLLASVKVSMNAGGVEVGNAMDGSDVVHTWVVTTNFAGEKK